MNQAVAGLLGLLGAAIVAGLVTIVVDKRPKAAEGDKFMTDAAKTIVGMLREELSRAESTCQAQISQLRTHFDESLGAEKRRCDALQEQVESLLAGYRPSREPRNYDDV